MLKFVYGQSISPYSTVYDMMTGTGTLNDFDASVHSMASGSTPYRSSLINSWSSYYIRAVCAIFNQLGSWVVRTFAQCLGGRGFDSRPSQAKDFKLVELKLPCQALDI